jgi:hypothetical protein
MNTTISVKFNYFICVVFLKMRQEEKKKKIKKKSNFIFVPKWMNIYFHTLWKRSINVENVRSSGRDLMLFIMLFVPFEFSWAAVLRAELSLECGTTINQNILSHFSLSLLLTPHSFLRRFYLLFYVMLSLAVGWAVVQILEFLLAQMFIIIIRSLFELRVRIRGNLKIMTKRVKYNKRRLKLSSHLMIAAWFLYFSYWRNNKFYSNFMTLIIIIANFFFFYKEFFTNSSHNFHFTKSFLLFYKRFLDFFFKM